ncbi:MBL fold metallo-hydrolase [Thiocapsa imhoffii]|nr:MBL fold metallo-hydrolase [Thiocapsa imhoffii]
MTSLIDPSPRPSSLFRSATHTRLGILTCLLGALTLPGANALAWEMQTQAVAKDVYALVGPTQNRTYDNYAINANLGFIVTHEGVVLIDSGATVQSGPLIEQAVAAVTAQPIRWVVNLGSQDHRWLGNAYFAERGAQIIALARTVETQGAYADSHLVRLRETLGDRLEGTLPLSAPEPIEADRAALDLGGVSMELLWLGDAHYVGDALLWLPESSVLFAGDLVYLDRILGVWPHSRIRDWRDTFDAMEELQPKVVVPGHGAPGDLAKAKRDTGDYLDWLVREVEGALDNWEPIDETVERLADAPEFEHLEHFDDWNRRNLNQTYLQLEAER